jgi:hypothetical protein
MVPVESSNVAAIGYSDECRLMRVQYRDGSIYDHPDVDPGCCAIVREAKSIGSAMALLAKDRPGVKLTQKPYTFLLNEPKPERPASLLQSIEHDDCCTPRFQKKARTGSLDSATEWTCPKCGVEYHPSVINGTVRHWTTKPYTILVRPRA